MAALAGPRRRSALVATLVAVTTAAVVAVSASGPFHLLDARLVDLAATLRPAEPSPDVVIVAIDEPSFADVGDQWPWPRALHGRLVRALRVAGARAIGFDVVFAEASNDRDDEAFAAALGPDVVLGADESVVETPQADQILRTEPLQTLTATGARSGLVSVMLDGDGVLRRVPPFDDGFARRLLEAAGERAAATGPGDLIAPVGPARTYRTVSYYQALDPAGTLPPGTFRDAIVLVGLSLQAVPDVKASGTDAFATPFTPRTGRLVPGVEVQAAILDTLRLDRAITASPASLGVALTALAALLAGLAVRRGTHPAAIVGGAAFTAAMVVGAGLLLAFRHVWVSPVCPALAFTTVLTVQGIADFAAERRLRRDIVRAFRQYLAPELVERLAAEPAALRLGGERRELTVLFCDLRGFTGIAERLKDEPERLTQLVNRVLDPLSDEILKRGGTIDKYMGDCVMAFWNAPLEEPDHAGRAVEAALAMVEAMARLSAAIEREPDAAGRPIGPLAVGVGVNTGEAVVGNMGSSARFDYTALGDTVNTAARLQTLTRRYDVPILVGDATRAALGDRFAFTAVDSVVPRGRTEPEAVWAVTRSGVAAGPIDG